MAKKDTPKQLSSETLALLRSEYSEISDQGKIGGQNGHFIISQDDQGRFAWDFFEKDETESRACGFLLELEDIIKEVDFFLIHGRRHQDHDDY